MTRLWLLLLRHYRILTLNSLSLKLDELFQTNIVQAGLWQILCGGVILECLGFHVSRASWIWVTGEHARVGRAATHCWPVESTWRLLECHIVFVMALGHCVTSQVYLSARCKCHCIDITLAHSRSATLFHFSDKFLAWRELLTLRYVRMISRYLRLWVKYYLIRTFDEPSHGFLIIVLIGGCCNSTNFFTLWSWRLILIEINELSFSCQINDGLCSVWFLSIGFLTDHLLLLREVFLLLQLLLLEILHENLVLFGQAGDSGRRCCQRSHIWHLLWSCIKLTMIFTAHIKRFALTSWGDHGTLWCFWLLRHVRHHMRLMGESLLGRGDLSTTRLLLLRRLLPRWIALHFTELH